MSQLHAQQADQHGVGCAGQIGVELEPRALEVLHHHAIRPRDRQRQRQAKDIQSAAAAPEVS